MISGVKSARFGIENVAQPETVTITETLRMSSVFPTLFTKNPNVPFKMFICFRATHCPIAGLARALGISSLVSRVPALQYRGRQQTIGSRTRKTRFSTFL